MPSQQGLCVAGLAAGQIPHHAWAGLLKTMKTTNLIASRVWADWLSCEKTRLFYLFSMAPKHPFPLLP